MRINKGFTKIYNKIISKYGDVIEDYNKDIDGYEIFLKDGYYWEEMGEGVRTLFEDDLNRLSKSVNKGIKKESNKYIVYMIIDNKKLYFKGFLENTLSNNLIPDWDSSRYNAIELNYNQKLFTFNKVNYILEGTSFKSRAKVHYKLIK